MIFKLVDHRYNLHSRRNELPEMPHIIICDTDGPYFTGFIDFFHLFPSLLIISWIWPMHQPKVYIISF